MSARKGQIYVVGDAGTDTLAVPKQPKVHLSSGAPFVERLLKPLLEPEIEVISLISKSNGVESTHPLPRWKSKQVSLAEYPGTMRVGSYAAPKEGTSKKHEDFHLDFERYEPEDDNHLLLAHHSGAGDSGPTADWSNSTLKACIGFIESFVKYSSPRPGLPQVLINVSAGLPQANPNTKAPASEPFRSPLWNKLFELRAHVGIVLSMSTLRAEGAVISRRLSFEHLVEDFCSELHLFPRLKALSHFRHVFVRVGMIAILHIERRSAGDTTQPSSNELFKGEIFFSPYAKDGLHRDQEQSGGTLGRNTILAGALARELLRRDAQPVRTSEPRFKEASRRALLAMKLMDDHGYHVDLETLRQDPTRMFVEAARAGVDVINGPFELCGTPLDNPKVERLDEAAFQEQLATTAFGWRPIPPHLLAPLPPRAATTSEPWHILDDVLLEAPVHRINVAVAVVMAGHERVLNRSWSKPSEEANECDRRVWELLARPEYWNPNDRAPDFVTLQEGYAPAMPRTGLPDTASIIGHLDEPFELSVPVMRLGALNLVERNEIESLRSIANLLRLHRKQAARVHAAGGKGKPKPISIAVFGPPGTGKSFAVKQLAKAVGNETELPHMEFNVTQFGGVHDLYKALAEVAKKTDEPNYKTTPLVFFDEFDCPLNNAELGWLKYFLAPMQDGKLEDGVKDIGPAIFVFAGGLHASFSRFDPRTDTAYDNLRNSDEYIERLKKFVGQKGPDFISRLRGHIDVLPINDLPGRPKHFIRRAMQLRSFLVNNKQVDSATGVANIDLALVYAFLTADRFRHGVRSMQAIVEMCSPIHGKIEIASLPSRAQLDMHVDATEFMIRVHRARARSLPEYGPLATHEVDWAARVLRKHLGDAAKLRGRDYRALDEELESVLKDSSMHEQRSEAE